jgi:Uroporphyrinogen-III decarboxylase
MTHRERFYNAVTHKPTDRAVFDLCGSPQTCVSYQITKDRLKDALGFAGEKRGEFDIDERILEAFDIDTRLIGGLPPMPPTRHCRDIGGVHYDSWGIGHCEMDGHWEMCHFPLKGATTDEVMAYEFPDPARIDMDCLQYWADKAEHLKKRTDYAVIAAHPVFGVFEIGCWLFGFDDYLYRLAAEPELVHAFSRRFLEFQKRVIEKYYAALGPFIDCTTSGDDFGMQTGPFMSAAMFDELVLPYFKERVEFTRTFTGAFYKHHTCGSVHNLIPSLIACGVDILNPIQPGVHMMEHARLKDDFGGRMTFWGGIDTQRLLPRGAPEEIRAEVHRILSIMDRGDGGYILAPAHTLQYDVPVENIIALYEAAKSYYAG